MDDNETVHECPGCGEEMVRTCVEGQEAWLECPSCGAVDHEGLRPDPDERLPQA